MTSKQSIQFFHTLLIVTFGFKYAVYIVGCVWLVFLTVKFSCLFTAVAVLACLSSPLKRKGERGLLGETSTRCYYLYRLITCRSNYIPPFSHNYLLKLVSIMTEIYNCHLDIINSFKHSLPSPVETSTDKHF